MLKNYFKIAFRNLRKQKLYSLINILGLSLGISCCIIIYLFIQDEYSFDRFHANGENIYRLEEIQYEKAQSEIEPTPFFDSRSPEGVSRHPYLPIPLGPTLKERIPEIVNYVRADESAFLVRRGDQAFEEDVLLADSSFFEIFSFPLIRGSAETVLDDPGNIVLTPESAAKYFGDEDPMGQSLILNIRGEEKVFTVSGIAKAPPVHSSIPFSMVSRIENKPFYERNMERWFSFNTPLFVELRPDADLEQFRAKLNDFAVERYGESWEKDRERLGLPEEEPVMEFAFTPLTGMHLNAAVEWPKVSNPLYSYILGAIAILILVIACINYITLALARSSGRAKEVGIRKASGAKRNQIALQFWGETQLLTLFAVVAGLCLAELLMPFFNSLAGKSLAISYLENAGFLGVLLGITVVTGLIAGSYPALVLSRYSPVEVLKSNSTFKFKPRLTKVLLVVQYSLSVFLIISSVIMFRQLDYVSGKDLGYEEDQLVFIPTHTGWNEEGTRLMELYRNKLNGVTGVSRVSGMAPAFTRGSNRYGFDIDGEYKTSYIYFVDEELVNTLGIELVAGRNFSADRPSDETDAIIVNQALVESMGWEEPIGQQLPWKGEENPSTVIGVMKDFHYLSLESEIQPMLFHMDHSQGGVASIAVKIEQGMIGETLPQLEEAWAEVAPFKPFNFWFLDDAVAQQYQDYRKWLQIMGVSTFMAILVACLGLFGLAGLTAVNRTKEIGIRKVLGAGIEQIILLLNKDVVKLIALSLLLAAPLSWYIMEQWLSDFAYRITIGSGVFIISAVFALAIAVATVSYHSLKAAMVNPAESLKNE